MTSGVEDTSPATELVQLALQKWAECHVKADNIGVIVVLFKNCKSLCTSAFSDDCSNFKEDRFTPGFHSPISVSDVHVKKPVNFDHVKKRLYKSHHSKKSQTRKPLALIGNGNTVRSNHRSVTRRKHEFKIPTTPEQRSAYWSRRRCSKMTENLSDLFANEILCSLT